MKSGQLDQCIEIQRNRPTANSANQPVEKWICHCSRWANVTSASAGSTLRGGIRQDTQILHIITIRRDADTELIEPSFRVIWNHAQLNIESKHRIGRGFFQLHCTQTT